MAASTQTTESATVAEILGKRLEELELSEEELAEAAGVPTKYITDLIAGRRRPPLPGRTDVYGRMTTLLGLGRNELAASAQSERDNAEPGKATLPKPTVRKLLMDLCDPETADELEKRRSKNGNGELIGYLERLLHLTQGAVARTLSDQTKLRVPAERAASFLNARYAVLEFLDATPSMLTPKDVTTFFHPRVAKWDVDLEAGVLRVVMHSHDQPGNRRRFADA